MRRCSVFQRATMTTVSEKDRFRTALIFGLAVVSKRTWRKSTLCSYEGCMGQLEVGAKPYGVFIKYEEKKKKKNEAALSEQR